MRFGSVAPALSFYVSFRGGSVKAVMQPAGLEKGIGIITAAYIKEPTNPQWQDTHEYKAWLDWMKKYNTSANIVDVFAAYGYSVSQTLISVLKACGDNLTRANVMRQAASTRDQKLPMVLPGITISTSADDFAPIKQMQLEKFDGTTWRLFGDVISGALFFYSFRGRSPPAGDSYQKDRSPPAVTVTAFEANDVSAGRPHQQSTGATRHGR
jgi:hypothetical protein